MTAKKISRRELLNDYRMLGKVSRLLAVHEKGIREIAKAVAKRVKSDLKYGLIENLDITAEHMKKAQRELRRAQSELKRI